MNNPAISRAEQQHEPLTIAYFSSSPGGAYSFEKWLMWRGMADTARDFGVNLLYVAGEEIEFHPQAILYDLIGTHNIDGFIFWNSFVSQRTSDETLLGFLDTFSPLPAVSIEREVPGCLNVLIDNDNAVRALLEHLIETHGHRQIAYISQAGNHSAEDRRVIFQRVMEEYGFFQPELVGSFEELQARGVRWGVDCRAIMAHADATAIEVMEMLRQHGLHVPEDVVVVGFNDGQEARSSLPPLTTMRLPFRRMGRKAVEALVKKLRGEPPPVTTVLESRISLRRSCGCLEPLAEQAAAGPVARAPEGDLHTQLLEVRAGLTSRLAPHLGTSDEDLMLRWTENLLDIFFAELDRPLRDPHCVPTSSFIARFSDLLREALDDGANVTRWHEAISILRKDLLPFLYGPALAFAEDLWQQARVLVGQVAARAETHRVWHTTRRAEILREIESELLIAFEFDELLDLFVRGLKRLGIRDVFLVLYEGLFDVNGRAQLALVVQNGERVNIDPHECTFPVRELLPEAYRKKWTGKSTVIEALHLRDQQLGYLMIEADPPADSSECVLFQALRIQLSSGLRAVRLRQKLQDARRQAEEANQLKSRFLSMVSHELRTPLNLIVGLSEMAIRQQSRGKDSAEVQQKFMEQIYVSGQHLDRLIRDVLDLASSQVGQMTLIRKPMDLVPVLDDVACMGEQLAKQKNLHFRVERPEVLPTIDGDKTRLRQILLNLLSNAVKFTGHGEVALIVKEEGDELLISVQDTGLGIPRQEQERIFDEFHQSNRSVARGYGGIGLGLAITRTLVEMHGGRIWVTSEGAEGSGSCFCFTLPVIQTDEEKDVVSTMIPGVFRHGAVLIVTRSVGDGAPLLAHLTENGFRVEEVALEETASLIESIIASPPGAVVLDIAPASEVGWDIMKRIKENTETQDIPVLFYSLLQDEDSGTVLEMDYLTKPVGAQALVNALKRHGLMNTGRNGNPVILIIDDEPGIRDLHMRMVQSELPNCRIIAAGDGLTGLALMRQEQPDLVLLDLMMPELDGFGVLKLMQSEDTLRGIPVIVLSGQVLTSREMAWLNQGVAAVLNKGMFRTQEIMSKITCVISRSRRLGSEAQRLVQQAIGYIHEHYNEPISRADIATFLSINEQYLSRCFNKELGIGPMVYLSRYRIQRAKRLLETGNLSITQVAMEIGMSSQSYFSRVFQEETGLTPSAYQRGVRTTSKEG